LSQEASDLKRSPNASEFLSVNSKSF